MLFAPLARIATAARDVARVTPPAGLPGAFPFLSSLSGDDVGRRMIHRVRERQRTEGRTFSTGCRYRVAVARWEGCLTGGCVGMGGWLCVYISVVSIFRLRVGWPGWW